MYSVLQCAQKGLHSINCNNNNIQFKMLFVYNRVVYWGITDEKEMYMHHSFRLNIAFGLW